MNKIRFGRSFSSTINLKFKTSQIYRSQKQWNYILRGQYRYYSSLQGFNFNQSADIPFGPFDGGDGPSALLNQNVRQLDMSPTVGISEMSNKLELEGNTVYKFGFGQSPFPVPKSMIKELENNAYQKAYLPVRGLQELREAISNKINQSCGISSTYQDVLVSPGSKEGIYCLQTAYYGELLLPAPSWVSYAPQAQIIGRQIRFIQTNKEDNYKLTATKLEEELTFDFHRPRIIILNSPSNPTGVSYTEKELKDIATLARRHRLIVLSDEIYAPLNHSSSKDNDNDINKRAPSISTYYPEGTIVLTGISKWCGAGGWRLGALVFPKQMRWLLDASAIIASETYTAASAPIQYGAIPAFRDYDSDEMTEYLSNTNKILSAIGKRFHNKLIHCGADCAQPNGAFYLFPDFSNVPGIEKMKEKWSKKYNRRVELFGSKDMTKFLLEECFIGGLGGAYFGRPYNELTMRLAYVDFDGKKILDNSKEIPNDENSSKMDAFLDKYASKTMKGIDILAEYMKSLSK